MRNDQYPFLKCTVRIKKMLAACWVVDLVADDGILVHPLEAFALSLCTGEYNLKTIRHIYSSVLRIEENGLIDDALKKLDRYVEWVDQPILNLQRYDPKEFLYDPKVSALFSENRFDTPGEMTIILTHECNFRCIYCFNSSGEAATVELNTAEWLRVIDQAKELGIVKCTVSGGEPMLHPGFFDILKSLTDSGMSVYTCTNGSLIDEDAVSRFKAMGLPCVQISLDAATSEIHDKMAAVKGTFPNVIRGIKLLVGSGLEVYIKSVITPLNFGDVDKLLDLCKELGVKRLLLDRFDISNAGRGNAELFMTRKQEVELERLVTRRVKEFDGIMKLMAVTIPRCWSSQDDLIICGAFRRSLNILPFGDISVCEKLIGVPEMTAGNVRNNTLKEIWNAPRIQDILNPNMDTVKQPCRDCELFDTCHTGCFAASMFVSESPYDVDPRCWKANLANNPYTKVVGGRM